MYGIFNYIWVVFRAHVGKYSIHGAYGLDKRFGKYKNRLKKVSVWNTKKSFESAGCSAIAGGSTYEWLSLHVVTSSSSSPSTHHKDPTEFFWTDFTNNIHLRWVMSLLFRCLFLTIFCEHPVLMAMVRIGMVNSLCSWIAIHIYLSDFFIVNSQFCSCSVIVPQAMLFFFDKLWCSFRLRGVQDTLY